MTFGRLQSIATQLNGSTLEALWANTSYMLAMLVFQPIYTSISDIIGRKPPLYASLLLFFVGSLVFAVAQSMAVVILGRVLQGAGAGGIDAFCEIIVTDITTLQERPLYLGILAVPIAIAAMSGPWIGALFSEYVTWRWIGWINLPLTTTGVVLIFFFLRLRTVSDNIVTDLVHVDWGGMALFLVGCTAFVLPISWASAMFSWSSWQTLVPLVLGSVTLVIFVWHESRPAQPIMPYHIFSSATAAVTLAGAFIEGMAMYVLLQYIYLLFQAVYLQTPLQSSLSVLPFSLVTVAFSAVSAFLVDYTRQYRWNIWFGWAIMTVGVGLLGILNPGSSVAERAGVQTIAGIGLGILHTTLAIPMQASVKHVDDSGMALGQMIFFRLFGAVVGLAIASAVFSSIFAQSITPLLPFLPAEIAVMLSNGEDAIGFIPQLRVLDVPDSILLSIQNAYMLAMRGIWWVVTGFSGVGLLLSCLMKELTLESDDLGRQQLEGRQHYGEVDSEG